MPSHRSSKENTHEAPRPTRKQERLNAHEQQQRRNILLAAAIFGGVILIILAIGLVDGYLITPKKVIATVGEEEITVAQYTEQARFTRFQMIQQTVQLDQNIQIYSMYGMDTTQFQSTLNYYQMLLDSEALLADAVMDSMIEEIIINNIAEALNITVTDEEVQAAIESQFGYYPDGTPTQEAFPTSDPLPTLNAEQLLLITPTATSEPTQIPEPTEEVVEAPAESDEDGEPIPTATPYTVELYNENYVNYLRDLSVADISEAAFLKAQRYAILREKVFETITAEYPLETEEQVWARHILVEDETAVQSVLGQLESGEMDFAELARLLSTDEGSGANGGDLGWFGRGQMVEPFEEAAFSLEIGEVSEAVESQFGYHIIQVIAKDEVVSAESVQQQARQEFFNEWLEAERASIETELTINDDLLARHTPSHPKFSDPDVFEVVMGLSIKDYNATVFAQQKQATEQVQTLTAQPPLEQITAEPTAEE